jgi:hypothetical protein
MYSSEFFCWFSGHETTTTAMAVKNPSNNIEKR